MLSTRLVYIRTDPFSPKRKVSCLRPGATQRPPLRAEEYLMSSFACAHFIYPCSLGHFFFHFFSRHVHAAGPALFPFFFWVRLPREAFRCTHTYTYMYTYTFTYTYTCSLLSFSLLLHYFAILLPFNQARARTRHGTIQRAIMRWGRSCGARSCWYSMGACRCGCK
jgi:hypothetical protein